MGTTKFCITVVPFELNELFFLFISYPPIWLSETTLLPTTSSRMVLWISARSSFVSSTFLSHIELLCELVVNASKPTDIRPEIVLSPTSFEVCHPRDTTMKSAQVQFQLELMGDNSFWLRCNSIHVRNQLQHNQQICIKWQYHFTVSYLMFWRENTSLRNGNVLSDSQTGA